MKCGKVLMLFFLLPAAIRLPAQPVAEALKQLLGKAGIVSSLCKYPGETKVLYARNGYQLAWMGPAGGSSLRVLRNYISHSASLGLRESDYQPVLFASTASGQFSMNTMQDSLLSDIQYTDAAIHFLHDVIAGNQPEPLSYNGLHYEPLCNNIPELLYQSLTAGDFESLLSRIEPVSKAYQSVKDQLNRFLEKVAEKEFKDVSIISGKVSSSNKQLMVRLYQLGLIATDTILLNDTIIKARVKEGQLLFGLLNDGVLRSTALEAFNQPLLKRIVELNNTLNCLRWLACMKEASHYIVVNIPSANLILYEKGQPKLESRIVVGKNSTPTPTLSSKITEVIVYPYWNVPNKIATKELLPLIKKYPAFLDENNYQVLDKQGAIVDPATVSWHTLSQAYFPYQLRQSTGCDNSLGLIKLNFYNPYAVYLHDTPWKYFFSMNKRYFSHGCMRVEKAFELARYVIRDKPAVIDSLESQGCLKDQKPQTIAATEEIPVFVLYQTAWISMEGRLSFHDDVYNVLTTVKK